MPHSVTTDRCMIVATPNEVLQEICLLNGNVRDIAALSRTCHSLRAKLGPFLHRVDARSLFPRALIWASIHGDVRLAIQALINGTDVNTVYLDAGVHIPGPESGLAALPVYSDQGATPLLLAAAGGHFRLCQILLISGADVEWLDDGSRSALYWAAASGNEDLFVLLLRQRPEMIHVEGQHAMGPLEAAISHGHFKLFKRLIRLKRFEPTRLFHVAVEYGLSTVFHWLLAHYPSTARSLSPRQILRMACIGRTPGHFEIAWMFVAQVHLGPYPPDADTAVAVWPTDFPRPQTMASFTCWLLCAALLLWSQVDGGTRTLLAAIERDESELVGLLLSMGADPCDSSKRGHNALAEACRHGSRNCLTVLLDSSAAPQLLAGESLRQAQLEACHQERADFARLLFSYGAPPPDEVASTVDAALASANFELLKVLLDYGAALPDHWPFILAQNSQVHESGKDLPELFQWLFANFWDNASASGAHIGQLNRLLHVCCQKGTALSASVLVNNGVDISGADCDGNSPLHNAIQTGNLGIVELLLANGVDLEAATGKGTTPLQLACKSPAPSRARIIKCLVDKGANLDCFKRPVMVVLKELCVDDDIGMGYPGYESQLLNAFAALMIPVLGTDAPDLSQHRHEAYAALQHACSLGNFPAAKRLLELGANPNACHPRQGPQPLVLAAHTCCPALVRLLLYYGADPNVQDGIECTPLYCSLRGGQFTMVRMFQDAGADTILYPEEVYNLFRFPCRIDNPALLRFVLDEAEEDPTLAQGGLFDMELDPVSMLLDGRVNAFRTIFNCMGGLILSTDELVEVLDFSIMHGNYHVISCLESLYHSLQIL